MYNFINISIIKKFVPSFKLEINDIVVLDTKSCVLPYYVLNIEQNYFGKRDKIIICRYFETKNISNREINPSNPLNIGNRSRRNCIGPNDLGELYDLGILLGILYNRENNAIIRLLNRDRIYNLFRFYKTDNNFCLNLQIIPIELYDKIFQYI